jgi:uncharacterized coiled-coil protein SlyX
MKITISRALKYKNRVVERMRKLEEDIRSGNAVIEGGSRDLDVRVAFQARMQLESHLVALKGILDKANEPIKGMIAQMQELKGRIQFLSTIPTTHGVQDARRTMYGETGSITYTAEIRKAELDSLVSAARQEIDTAQDNIDKFNGANTIEIDMLPLN